MICTQTCCCRLGGRPPLQPSESVHASFADPTPHSLSPYSVRALRMVMMMYLRSNWRKLCLLEDDSKKLGFYGVQSGMEVRLAQG